ncbi:hypothetical protein [Kutzneria sp. 744]|uniref:hypothetical protein n=1 Tax=Kutzneria sp. (strain 744) TaxID=345341 RepID=UPI0003EEB7E9|nr:hypothetical protein [Kutzneria sp. 744]EWM18012.1 hypothetical protein KUTG_08316 [Kutzneria sp. 744]
MSDNERSAAGPDPAWLAAWRHDINTVTQTLVADFENRFGYPPGRNDVDEPGPAELDAARQLAEHSAAAEPLVRFYRHIGEVVLADVGNAYFIHPAAHVVDDLASSGPIRLGPRDRGVVFASDGGGIHFAIATSGAVHRSAAASRDSDFHLVADGLQDFLDRLRRAVVRFVETGRPGDL